MSYEPRCHSPLHYNPVSYPGSVLKFRGPAVPLDGRYLLCLGGSETFGRFIHTPFCRQMSDALDMPVVNMGVVNAGLDVMMQDKAIRAAARGAAAIVLQITGAQNMTNRFYSVHPRRNDRFLEATPVLKSVFPDVDFTEFHFNRHLLSHLRATSRERFALVVAELQTAWLAKMAQVLQAAQAPVHMLWLSSRRPDQPGDEHGLGRDPLFITSDMLSRVAAQATSLTIAVSSPARLARPAPGMIFSEQEAAAARVMPGPDVHDMAAIRLSACVTAPGGMRPPRPADAQSA